MTTEKRCLGLDQSQLRVESRADGGETLHGYGMVFYNPANRGTEYELWPGIIERMRPSAADGFLQADVLASFNHNLDNLLGRRSNNTLRLFKDDIGLRYEIDLPSDEFGKRIANYVRRGDLKGSSFAANFTGIEYEDLEDRTTIRWVTKTDGIEIGPVAMPAYEATTAQMRSLGESLEKARADRERNRKEHFAIERQILDLTLSVQ